MSEERIKRKIRKVNFALSKNKSKFAMVDFEDDSRYTFFKEHDVEFLKECVPGIEIEFIGWQKNDWYNGKDAIYAVKESLNIPITIKSIEGSDALTDLMISIQELLRELISEIRGLRK